MDEKAKNNGYIGRLYYQAICDGQGYPNGMPYWAEMKADDKYHYAADGISFLEMAQKAGLITFNKPMGFAPGSEWGSGDCAALIEHYKDHEAEEKAELERRIGMLFNKDKK